MLKTERNTPEMAARVLEAARAYFDREDLQVDFEHGQFWVSDVTSGAQYSVCDAEGGDSVDGFIFEQVTEGDEA